MDETRFMKRAIALARRGRGAVEPNPMVGCVIVKAGRVVGAGYHRRFGGPHAEVHALREAGRAARGATAYVTLEPCSHFGKTPPCAEALIAAGLKRVAIGVRDPHPQSGGGVAVLRRAGIEVEVGLCAEQCAKLVAPFIKGVEQGLPYVTLKWAQTLDGSIATSTGDSQWISNEQSRQHVHRLRGMADVVMVGIGTALTDDPQLTARGVRVRRVARRVVVDPELRLPSKARLLATLDEAPLTLAVSRRALTRRSAKADRLCKAGVELVPLADTPDRHGLLKLRPLLKHLHKAHQATHVLVEGGAGLTGALLAQRLADELLVFAGPKMLIDGQGLPPSVLPSGLGAMEKMKNAQRLRLCGLKRLGDDVMLRYTL